MQKLHFHTKFEFSSLNFFFFNKLEELFSEVNIHCDKLGQGDRTEGKKGQRHHSTN